MVNPLFLWVVFNSYIRWITWQHSICCFSISFWKDDKRMLNHKVKEGPIFSSASWIFLQVGITSPSPRSIRARTTRTVRVCRCRLILGISRPLIVSIECSEGTIYLQKGALSRYIMRYTYTVIYIYMYIYIYMCVCVCACVYSNSSRICQLWSDAGLYAASK